MDYLYALSTGFFEFAREEIEAQSRKSNLEADDIGLEWLLGEWARRGGAIEDTAGRFSTYLQVAIIVLARIAAGDVEPLGHYRFSLKQLDVAGSLPAFLDRSAWEAMVFKYKFGRVATPNPTV